MGLVTIDIKEFDEWRARTFVEYASAGGKPHKDGRYSIARFYVSIDGIFRVTLGEKTLYEGQSLGDAAKAFHWAQK